MAKQLKLSQSLGESLNTDQQVIRTVLGFYTEAKDAKDSRLTKNTSNRDAFLGNQDLSEKIAGQSREFLPKTAIAVEQFAAFFKRAITQTGPNWFELIVPQRAPLDGGQCARLLNLFIENLLLEDGVVGQIHTAISDAARLGALESLCILKVHWNWVDKRTVEGAEKEWKLRVDVVKFENYFPDPSGKGLYEIFEVERDLWEVQARAAEGQYDQEAVDQLKSTMRLRNVEGDRRAVGINQSETSPPFQRHKVVIREFWGTLLNDDGSVLMHNCTCAIANERFLIRKPVPNPFWHGMSPFVCAPIIRVPGSTHHKAIFDEASALNFAMNELYNLFIDGALASVWGIRQLRQDFLDDPNQVSDGIPQGETLICNSNLPPGEKVLEVVASGVVPPDAMAMMESLNREFSQAALTNELKLGQLPGRSVRATEVVEASQGLSSIMDGIAGDLERTFIAPLLKRCFLMILQHFHDIVLDMRGNMKTAAAGIAEVIGASEFFKIMNTPPEELYNSFASSVLRVRGLSSSLERSRNFPKLMAWIQVVTTNPVFLQDFVTRFSPALVSDYMLKLLQLDPSDFVRAGREVETQRLQATLQTLPMFQQLLSQKGEGQGGFNNPNLGGTGTGGGPIPAEVNQQVNPLSGMTANQ